MIKKKKILITGGSGMLAYDFYKYQNENFEIILLDKKTCNITSFESILQNIALYEPDVVLNCAAYTAVDDAEDIGAKENYEVNALGVYLLAKATSTFGVDFITISTDYVFDGENPNGYNISDIPNPINAYGMAKYLGEKLALDANPNTKIIRTSWLYGGEILQNPDENYPNKEKWIYKNFVNTMLFLSSKYDEVKVVDDQFGGPTDCRDLSEFIAQIINNEEDYENFFHFSSPCKRFALTWADFAEKIFAKYQKNTRVIRVSSEEFITKAKRPKYGVLIS